MNLIWTPSEVFRRVEYKSEADLEAGILEVQQRLFGKNRYYVFHLWNVLGCGELFKF
jgi:hypothetical protein